MQRNVIIAAVIIVVLGAGAFFFVQNKNKISPNSATSGNTNTNGNVVTSIKDALSKSVSMECTYTAENTGEAKTYIKNGAIRSDYSGKTTGQGGSIIIVDKKMYLWQGKQGMMMEIPEVTGQPQGGQGAAAQKEDFMASLEKYKDSCKPAVVSDSLFTPPADVQFKDYSQMMRQVPKAPGGAYPSVSEEQMQQYQQYQNQTP